MRTKRTEGLGYKSFQTQRATILRRALNFAGPVLEGSKLINTELTASDFVHLATGRTKLTDFGDFSPESHLDVLLAAIREEANLNFLGRLALKFDTLRLLSNLLHVVANSKTDPDILTQQIRSPVFIMGLPRTASTFLHSLFAQDPSNRIPTTCEVAYPWLNRSQMANKARKDISHLNVLTPEFQATHPFDEFSPQECSEILSNVFQSLRFDTTYDIPSYVKWFDESNRLRAHAFHKLLLQHFQKDKGPGRWILKCPDHVFSVEDILRTYPDALIILTHRDPGKVIPSVAGMTYILQQLFSNEVSLNKVINKVHDRWAIGAQRVIDIATGNSFPRSRIFNVFYEDLVNNPLLTIERLYAFIGQPLSDTATKNMQAFISKAASGKYRDSGVMTDAVKLDLQRKIRDTYSGYISYLREYTEPIGSSRTGNPSLVESKQA